MIQDINVFVNYIILSSIPMCLGMAFVVYCTYSFHSGRASGRRSRLQDKRWRGFVKQFLIVVVVG